MKRKLIFTALISLLISGSSLVAQENGKELSLTLKEAQDYAMQNNKMVKSAKLTVEGSQSEVWSAIASGLPQISASAGYVDNFKLGVFFLTMNNVPTIIQMGSTYSVPMNLQVSLPLFNAPYYIGIETVKLAQKLAASNLQNIEIDNRQSVASAYYLILVSEESLRILKDNLENLRETLKSTKAMYATGMAEASDVDQMVSNVTMVENSFSNLQSTIEVNYNLLRFLLGVKADTKITLTETLIWSKTLMCRHFYHKISIPLIISSMILWISRFRCRHLILKPKRPRYCLCCQVFILQQDQEWRINYRICCGFPVLI